MEKSKCMFRKKTPKPLITCPVIIFARASAVVIRYARALYPLNLSALNQVSY